MARFSRRTFLAASTTAPVWLPRRVPASDVIRVAVVGVNGRGMGHVNGFAGRKDAQVVAICDADENVFAKAKSAVESKTGKAPVFFKDIRKLLEDKSIDVVAIATPNHWHALGSIWAMQAGKDVYVEKPVSHNVREGRAMVEVARRLGRICQTGTQSRSNPGMKELIAFVRSGKIGKIKVARALCYKPRASVGKVAAPGKPPAGVDYDLWLGPAPGRTDVPRTQFHYDWHWQWDYGNGDLGNQGVHEMDRARWGLGKSELPRSVISVGGRFGYEDDGQTANTQVCIFDYGDAQLVFEVRGLKTEATRGVKIGNVFHGTDGTVVSGGYDGGAAFDPKGQQIAVFKAVGDHFDNFLQAVRSRKHADLACDILDGHLSSALCHLGNISYRLGKPVPFGKIPSVFANNKEAEEAFGRLENHLKDNGVALDKTRFRMGPTLSIDAKTERFVGLGSKEANPLLSREYRKGFVVPSAT